MYCTYRLFTSCFVVLLLTSSCLPVVDVVRVQQGKNSRSADESVTHAPSATEDAPRRHRRQTLEALFAHACMAQTSFGWHDKILVAWPADLPVAGEVALRIMTASGRIYLERHAFVEAGTVLKLGYAYQLPAGIYYIMIMPTPMEYHVGGLRISRKIAIQVNRTPERTFLANNECQ